MLFVNIKIGEILWAAPPVIKRTSSPSLDTLCVTFIGSVCRLVRKTNVKGFIDWVIYLSKRRLSYGLSLRR